MDIKQYIINEKTAIMFKHKLQHIKIILNSYSIILQTHPKNIPPAIQKQTSI